MQIKNKQTNKQTINYKQKQKQINKVSNQRNENNQKNVFLFSVKLISNCNRIDVKAGITHLLNSLTHYFRLKMRLIGNAVFKLR